MRWSALSATTTRASTAGEPDPLSKSEKLRKPIATGPFHATDIGAHLKMSPIPALTMGGLTVDEDTGAVLSNEGGTVGALCRGAKRGGHLLALLRQRAVAGRLRVVGASRGRNDQGQRRRCGAGRKGETSR